ncbi:MAG: sulfite exporter TauE/SafE family protein, partial [Deltaproteobacteria bacterium]|nr:sulfite exporter TauE/SafE family protein [Deltaproteobacteria bacterium]
EWYAPYGIKEKQLTNGESLAKLLGIMTFNPTYSNSILFIMAGIIVGIAASFTGLGGGFIMVPLLIFIGFSAQEAVGTSFAAILVISLSAVFAHSKFQHVDFKVGALLGLGGILGAQVGARLLQNVSTGTFKKIFAVVLLLLAAKIFFQK